MDISRNFVLDEIIFTFIIYDFAVFKEATRKKWGFSSIDEALKTRARVIYNKTAENTKRLAECSIPLSQVSLISLRLPFLFMTLMNDE
jgi:hypothetical protein